MMRPTTTTAVVSCLGLALACGCGSIQPRTSSDFTSSSESSFQTTAVSNPSNGDLQPGESPLFTVPTYSVPIDQLTLAEISTELEAMAALDRQMVDAAVNTPDTVVQARIAEADQVHADRLKEIVDAVGWPTAELVGKDGAQGAFLVIQHAGHDTPFQNRCLGLMVDLVNQGQLPAPYVALLTDRIRMFKGQPQLFGTQMTFQVDDDGTAQAVPSIPIEDISNLDTRRAMMNMPPHDHFARTLEAEYTSGKTEGEIQSAAVEAWTE